MSYGPCMCGGCRTCLHDQGYHCGDTRCCGPTRPLVVKVRFDAADYSWEGEETGYVGHGDRLVVTFIDSDTNKTDTVHFEFPDPYASSEEFAEVVRAVMDYVEEADDDHAEPPEQDYPDYDADGDDDL